VVATYLAGGNTRRIRGALQPLLKAAPLSKSAVSRVVATLARTIAMSGGRPDLASPAPSDPTSPLRPAPSFRQAALRPTPELHVFPR